MKKSKLAVCMAFLSCLAGCSSNMDKLPVSIYDSNVETMLDVREGTTVDRVLEKAEIKLNDGDTVSPALDTAITGTETDIFIKRSETNQKYNAETDWNEAGNTAANAGANTDTEDAESMNTENAEKTGQEKQITKETEEPKDEEPSIVSKEKIYDCDGSGHGYYLIKWSDGKEEYEDF